MFEIEREIGEWRGRLASGGSIGEERLNELEVHLRDALDDLGSRGLDAEEAFLIATRRIGNLDALAGEFARAGSEGEWRRIALEPADTGGRDGRLDLWVTVGLALGAGLLAKLPALFGYTIASPAAGPIWVRNAALFCLPSAALLLAWLRSRDYRARGEVAARFGTSPWFRASALLLLTAVLAVYVNLIDWKVGGQTVVLTGIHLTLFLWISLLPLQVKAPWADRSRWMDFVRFTGETFVYGVLLACGVGVLQIFTVVIFQSAGIRVEAFARDWIMIVGFFAVPTVAMRLALAKRSVVETIAPLLARIFGPLFLVAMLAFVAIVAVSGRNPFAGRDALIVFDLVLALVFALVLYSTAMRDPRSRASPRDWVDLALVVSAFGIDLALLLAMFGRIGSWGLTPNRLAALGENCILLAVFGGAGIQLGRHLLGKGAYAMLLRWETAFVPVIFAWAGIVALGFPLVFGGS